MAYQVAILDDEELIREGITLKYPFEENGFEIVFSGDDGNILLEKMLHEEIMPDVIFIDILMPRLNGLEFIEKLRNATSMEVEIVVISGHDQFEFAQRAIRLQVKEYLLKPLNPIELERVMERILIDAKNKREKRREWIKDEIAGWLNSGRQKISLTGEAAQLMDTVIQKINHLYVVLFGNLQSMSVEYQAVRTFFSGEYDFEISSFNEYNLFIHFDNQADFVNRIYRNFNVKTITIAHFPSCKNRDMLPRYVACGIHWIHHKLSLGRRIHETLVCSGTIEDHMLKLENDDVAEWKQFEGKMRQQSVSFDMLRRMIEKPMPQYIKENMVQLFAREYLQYEISKDWMQQFDNAEDFVEECLYLLQNATDALRPTKGKDILKCVLKDMQSEYFKNLTIKDYADRYHIHPNHLVRLFKQELETTYYQTLVDIRMQKAVKALTETNLKIIEIAEQVGYDDPGYFAQVFRKVHQITPNDYRKRLLEC